MDKTYTPHAIEARWYKEWEDKGYFRPQGSGAPYCIMLPPPNVTGSLHMGHGFQHTLMDALIRYHRMCGDQTLWQPGTDHAGISTQLVVENNLLKENILRKDLSREEFVAKVWEWKDKSGNQITRQMQVLGASCDWSRERFTMDEGLSFAVQKVFIQLYEDGLIYRGNRLVNWDPKLGTAVSDLEVISAEEDGFLYHIRYFLENSKDSIVIATTRPETLLGDTAVAVHPDDKRYKKYIGKNVCLPLCRRSIPIIADTEVDPDFGTGCVKITPAHDFNDYQMGKRHDLPMISIFTKKGTLNKEAPVAYQGMHILKARARVLQDLKALNQLVKEEPHRLKVPRGEKSAAIIEPLLTDQWYVKVETLAKKARDAVTNEEVRFIPQNWTKTYFQWMDNLDDWCISRQLWWGHRIPAWYDSQGRVLVGYNEEDVRFRYQIAADMPLKQDEDVLDTWFSSALWPFTTLGWPEHTNELKTFYPTSVLITGFDIIFFWVARMLMLGLKFIGKVPFKEVLITGLILDSEGQKMSKSKGNVIDPMDIIYGISCEDLIKKRTSALLLPSQIERITKHTKKAFPDGIAPYGVDALRFTFCALGSHTRQIRFDIKRVEGYRNFCNKLWNAARFVIQNIGETVGDWGDEALQYSHADLWVRSCLQQTIGACHEQFKNYRFDKLAQILYEFVWHTYCDWYLEFSKTILYDTESVPAAKRATKETLIYILETILSLLHPLMPFITEEINFHLNKTLKQETESLMHSAYPIIDAKWVNPLLEEEFNWLQDLIESIRTIRSEMQIPPSVNVPLILKNVKGSIKKRIVNFHDLLINLCKLNSITLFNQQDTPPASASAILGEVEILIPLAGLIDKDAELLRLDKAMAKLDKDINFITNKLNNSEFINNAPPLIITKEREKLLEATTAKDKLIAHQVFIQKM
ncbi:MAG: valine--tRNA ligase [Legionellales bacterium RIFCSPHIGHO2_12_FULL_37_14]|nr:MAG: valine--tRNA ligase [Legionellales bacterium RIFCSPHIGHO2_12_FULL_37_14]